MNDELEKLLTIKFANMMIGKEYPSVGQLVSAAMQIIKQDREVTILTTAIKWRIEQWRRARPYILEKDWKPIFDELCDLEKQMQLTTNSEVKQFGCPCGVCSGYCGCGIPGHHMDQN